MSKQKSTLDLLVELTTEEQQFLSGGQDTPEGPTGGGDDQINRRNRVSTATPIPQ
ncbi:hypothetical protein H6H01_06630 [Nostoc calcicola FACHB-3891]|nr:hypothetical protein [Nostoc calcicola FACHB-3891]MDZ8058221.1 hypothetical protein [Nostoc sp. EkiNYC01]